MILVKFHDITGSVCVGELVMSIAGRLAIIPEAEEAEAEYHALLITLQM